MQANDPLRLMRRIDQVIPDLSQNFNGVMIEALIEGTPIAAIGLVYVQGHDAAYKVTVQVERLSPEALAILTAAMGGETTDQPELTDLDVASMEAAGNG